VKSALRISKTPLVYLLSTFVISQGILGTANVRTAYADEQRVTAAKANEKVAPPRGLDKPAPSFTVKGFAGKQVP